MVLQELLREVEGRGVALSVVEDRLRFRPASRLTPELVEGLRAHKAAILERLDGGDKADHGDRLSPSPEQTAHGDPPALAIKDTAEVLELARARFGELAHPEEAPYPPPEMGRDPLVHRHTDKARYFAGARARELERRRREGLPPWIRLVDGGGAA